MSRFALSIIIGIAVSFARPALSQEIWAGKDGNIRNVDARAMASGGGVLYLATKGEVYRLDKSSGRWVSIFAISSGGNEIRSIATSLETIFVGTKRGLFRSDDGGLIWRNVFKTIVPEKSDILWIEVSKKSSRHIFIGTGRGVFASEDLGERWRDVSGILRNRAVASVAADGDRIYAVADGGLYSALSGTGGWERLYVQSGQAEEALSETGEPGEEDQERLRSVNCVALEGERIYIGVDKSILYSDDRGAAWKPLSGAGLAGTMNFISADLKNEKLYCATTKGVYEYTKEADRWNELYKGASRSMNTRRLAFGADRALWAMTDKGVWRLELGRYASGEGIDIEMAARAVKAIFAGEPSFKELQQAALKYAEVDPEKIKKWRAEARLKAVMPKVNLSLDKNRSTSAEIYTSATKDYIVTGPDDITNSCDVSVSWELGDLIWSDDQANIDVRSRLTTQLRNDILDDLRRAYFERKRLQFELLNAGRMDMKTRFEKELRIRELTQQIDDLTGNYLSEYLESKDGGGLGNGGN